MTGRPWEFGVLVRLAYVKCISRLINRLGTQKRVADEWTRQDIGTRGGPEKDSAIVLVSL